MRKVGILIAVFASLATSALAQHQIRTSPPLDPNDEAKRSQIRSLVEQARQKFVANDIQGTISLLQSAAELENGVRPPSRSSKGYLARQFVRLNRSTEALIEFKHALMWDESKNALNGSNSGILLEYALVLSKNGRVVDAKALYYEWLRTFGSSRSSEPAPFVVVFDPEPSAIVWEYTPARFEAAVRMLQVMAYGKGFTDPVQRDGESGTDLINRVRELAPDWFYPRLYIASKMWKSPQFVQILAEAESLARPGLEREIVTKFRVGHSEHLAINLSNDTPDASDSRPMTEGQELRKLMHVLKPNPEILKRLSTRYPGS